MSADTHAAFDPDWVVAPGETLKGWFEEIGLPYVVAARYGIPERTLARIINGKQPITPKLAQKLCNLTHVGAPFWLALEHNFRVGRAGGDVSERVLLRMNGGPHPGTRVADTELMPWPLPDELPDPELMGVYRKVSESQLPPQPEGSFVMRGAEYDWHPYAGERGAA